MAGTLVAIFACRPAAPAQSPNVAELLRRRAAESRAAEGAAVLNFIGSNEERAKVDGTDKAYQRALQFLETHPELRSHSVLVAYLAALKEREHIEAVAREQGNADADPLDPDADLERVAAGRKDVERLIRERRFEEALRLVWDLDTLVADQRAKGQLAKIEEAIEARRTRARWLRYQPVIETPRSRRVIVPSTPFADPSHDAPRWAEGPLPFGAKVMVLARADSFWGIRLGEWAGEPLAGVQGWIPRGSLADEERFERERGFLERLARRAKEKADEKSEVGKRSLVRDVGRPRHLELQLGLRERGWPSQATQQIADRLHERLKALARDDSSACLDLAPYLDLTKKRCSAVLAAGLSDAVLDALAEAYPLSRGPLESGVHRNLARFIASFSLQAAFGPRVVDMAEAVLRVAALRRALRRETLPL